MTVISITSTEDRIIAASAWEMVFRSTDPFGWPFSDSLTIGRVLFPTDGYDLSRDQFDALAQVAVKRGETHCYVAVVEGHARIEANGDATILMIDFADYESYASLCLPLENAMFSISGGWGVLISHELHAVLGSTLEFISEFNQLDQSAAEQWRAFKAQWQAKRDAKWVAEIASHLRS